MEKFRHDPVLASQEPGVDRRLLSEKTMAHAGPEDLVSRPIPS
jgi:hypothetical protein